MAKFKLKTLPKKPKKSASNATKENYLKKVAEVKKHNTQIANAKKKAANLDKRLASISGASVRPGK